MFGPDVRMFPVIGDVGGGLQQTQRGHREAGSALALLPAGGLERIEAFDEIGMGKAGGFENKSSGALAITTDHGDEMLDGHFFAAARARVFDGGGEGAAHARGETIPEGHGGIIGEVSGRYGSILTPP